MKKRTYSCRVAAALVSINVVRGRETRGRRERNEAVRGKDRDRNA
jgi:hypothetical protein